MTVIKNLKSQKPLGFDDVFTIILKKIVNITVTPETMIASSFLSSTFPNLRKLPQLFPYI